MSDPLKEALARHGVTDPEKFLSESDAGVDSTYRIDGTPVKKIKVSDYCAQRERRLRWL